MRAATRNALRYSRTFYSCGCSFRTVCQSPPPVASVRTARPDGPGPWRPDSSRALPRDESGVGPIRRHNWGKRNQAASTHTPNKRCTRMCTCKPRPSQAADPCRNIRNLDVIRETYWLFARLLRLTLTSGTVCPRKPEDTSAEPELVLEVRGHSLTLGGVHLAVKRLGQ